MFVEWLYDRKYGTTRIWVAGMVDGQVLNVRNSFAGPPTLALICEAITEAASTFLYQSLLNAQGQRRPEIRLARVH